MNRTVLLLLSAACVAAVFAPAVAVAQVDGYHFTGVNFNFANPGARARGIGGAFVALADDATASLANPAGLAFLERQFSLEVIRDQERAPVGQVTQEGLLSGTLLPLASFTAVTDPGRVWAESESTRISNASFVLPIAGKAGVSLYYSSLADLNQDYRIGAGVACVDAGGSPLLASAGQTCGGPVGGDFPRWMEFSLPQEVLVTLTTELMGAGFGWRFSDSFSIGASAALVEATFDGLSSAMQIPTTDGDLVGTPSQLRSTVDGQDYMYSAGILYRGERLGFGLSYRSETAFDILSVQLDADGEPVFEEFAGEFRIPERLAAGLAWFAGDNWVIAAEYARIPYSVMPQGMPTQFFTTREDFGVEYESSDVDEIHIGGEYTTFVAGKGWSIRVGYWREQTHLIYSSQGYNDPVVDIADIFRASASLLNRELDLNFDHFTAGFGASIGSFRVDAAVDYSTDAGTDFLLSGVLYF